MWAAFSANDINNDNELDVVEIKLMMWLMEGKRPINQRVEREISIIDTDGNGTVDRIEWLTYVCAPPEPGSGSMGNKNYFDLGLFEYFKQADTNNEGFIRID